MLEEDKVPSLDGFPISFYKECWETLKVDLMEVIRDFYEKYFLDRRSNATFVSLILKKDGVSCLTDFIPISLVGSTYKIIFKCLLMRLKLILPSIISKEQLTFMSRRSNTDGFLYASECIDDTIRSGVPMVICKLDMEKTYDHVN